MATAFANKLLKRTHGHLGKAPVATVAVIASGLRDAVDHAIEQSTQHSPRQSPQQLVLRSSSPAPQTGLLLEGASPDQKHRKKVTGLQGELLAALHQSLEQEQQQV
jgi:hypothetical protein